jgi:dCTP diphosphatase
MNQSGVRPQRYVQGWPWHPFRSGHSARMAFTDRSLEDIRREVAQFADERDWQQFHSPRNLLLALVGEVGEVAEIVRWQGDNDPAIPEAKREDWADELADVLTLLVRLADQSGVDLTAAFATKLEKARARYPIAGFRGSNRKYNEPPGTPPSAS